MSVDPSSKKYSVIVSTAKDLFWKYGFKRVSIEELCDHAKVSKMTFYKYFPNKIELAKTVFVRESEAGLKKFRSILQEEIASTDKLKKIVQLKVEGSSDISNDFLQDFYKDENEGLKNFVIETSRTAWLTMIDDIRDAQRQQIFTDSIKPELLVHLTQVMGSLITNKELLSCYSSPSELIGELTHMMAYGLAPENQK
jgi:AcrR family transcriptional regulator